MSCRIGRRATLKALAGAATAAAMPAMFGGCAPAGVRGRGARRPNIVFVMTDDHAQSALGVYGNKVLKTPHLDRIGNEGLRFDQAFVTNALCLPSRASFLTGQYSHTHGLRTNGEESGFTDEPALRNADTWPNLLRANGYHTGVVGKWHVNTPPQGYDYTAVLPGQGQYFDPPMLVNGTMTTQSGHTDDVIGEQALRFVRDRPKDRPFALLFQFKAPHRGWEPAPRFAHAFDDVDIPLPDTLYESVATRPQALRKSDMRIADMPDFRAQVPASLPEDERARRNFEIFIRRYYSVLLGVDENVGRMLELLDREGLAEDTIVLYTSDNGFFLGEHGLFDKRLMYEPAIRVPMLLCWPGGIAAGRVDDRHFALNIDVAPSLLDLAGGAVPATMQGASWKPLLEGNDPAWRRDFLYEYYESPPCTACARTTACATRAGSTSAGTWNRRRRNSTTCRPIRTSCTAWPGRRSTRPSWNACADGWPNCASNTTTTTHRATRRSRRRRRTARPDEGSDKSASLACPLQSGACSAAALLHHPHNHRRTSNCSAASCALQERLLLRTTSAPPAGSGGRRARSRSRTRRSRGRSGRPRCRTCGTPRPCRRRADWRRSAAARGCRRSASPRRLPDRRRSGSRSPRPARG
jgi:arylsulfatase A-like enzyme